MRIKLNQFLLATASILVTNGHALAQDVDAAIPSAEEATSKDDIVVTGSRVITNGNSSPTPLTVVSVDEILTATPSTISDAVNNLPVFSAPRSQVSNPNTGIGAGGGGNAVANQLNLRNLLPQRTLVLFDGHRVAPTTSTGIVDSDAIPQYLLKRVEVVTGGVSAVYGSDAVAGVVNFITDKDFNGLKAHAQTGVSWRGDAPSWNAGAAYGTRLGDRAHIEFSYEYRNDEGIDYRSSRPEIHRWIVANTGTAAFPLFLTGDAVRTDLSFFGVVNNCGVAALACPLAGQEFKTPGVLAARTLGTATADSNIRIGGDGAYFDGSLKAAQRSHQIFARFDYDLTDDISFYVEGSSNFKRNAFWGQNLTLTNAQIHRDNAYLDPAYRTALTTAGQTFFRLGKIIQNAPRIRPVIDSTQWLINSGIEGKFGGGWRWELGYIHSESILKNTEYNNINNLKLAAALDAVTNSSGQVVCNVTLTNPTAFPGCVPINVFGAGTESAAALNYILETTHFNAHTKQDEVSGSIAGSPFSTWAGEVKVALSGEWRHQSYRSDSDAETTAVGAAACAPLRLNCTGTTTQGWFQTFPNRTPISQSVAEGAVEIDVPLLADVRFVEGLNLTGALRYTSYNTSGNYWTWKVGGVWEVSDELRFRVTRSRDIRAPTLDDLFAASSCFPASTTDLLVVQANGTNPTSTATDCTVANPSLRAEVGNTLTAGMVYKPNWAPGLSLSFDYYDIDIGDAITQLVGTNVSIQRGCYNSGGTSIYCSLQDRALGSYTNTDPANLVTAWRRQPFNISKITTSGFDFELNYAARLGSRPFSFRTMVTYQPHVRFFQPDLQTFDMGGVAFGQNGTQANPKWRVAAFLNYSPVENFTISIMERWRSALSITSDPLQIVATSGVTSTPAYATTNINLAWKIPHGSGSMEFFLNVQNLFDNIASPANFNGSRNNIGLFGGFPIGDDPVGRYITSGVKFRF